RHRIRNIRDVLKMGQTVRVKVLAIDEGNKIKLSKRVLEPNSSRPSEDDQNKQKKSPFDQNRYNKNKF
ncbi:MAG: S1 RNA-binding domain-containing protein, partial [Candidatus Aminicenantes bacterium]|nr:S1 RNA-binding domain-containing protein [Candidatus Aminicenantes bacterium]